MHAEAYEYVRRTAADRTWGSVVEIGGRHINGGVRDLIQTESYTALDLYDGPGVDVVADCRHWSPPAPVDLVICCEVLEHADDPAAVVAAGISYLAKGGRIVITAASLGRRPHSTYDGAAVRDGEHYGNVDPADLREWLGGARGLLSRVELIERAGVDVYATGVRR